MSVPYTLLPRDLSWLHPALQRADRPSDVPASAWNTSLQAQPHVAPAGVLKAVAPSGGALLEAAATFLVPALQPIVDAHTGALYGVEALMRGFDRVGAASPIELLDRASVLGVLPDLERILHKKAVRAYAALPEASRLRLFLNIDGRAFTQDQDAASVLHAPAALSRHGLPPSCLALEICERQSEARMSAASRVLLKARGLGVRLAADDFGQGHSRLQMLYDGILDYVKIDRSFITGIDTVSRKRLFVGQLVGLAHMLGIRVVAEGVETEEEYLTCCELGVDLIQGWYVAKPSTAPNVISAIYHHVSAAAARGRRRRDEREDTALQLGQVERIEPVRDDADIETVFERFRHSDALPVVPVVDHADAAFGVIRERDLRPFIYGRFGRDLLRNRNSSRTTRDFAIPCPNADVRSDPEALLRIFAAVEGGCEGILLSEGGRYVGFVSASALVAMLHAQRVRQALDQNPLTGLPGNLSVAAHADKAAVKADFPRYLCYFDFDAFKPFNDRFGFRQGDRAIMLFAEALRRHLPKHEGHFLGHIGGDDFFAGMAGMERAACKRRIQALLADFRESASGLYDAADRESGYIVGRDRDDVERRYPLLRCSAAVLEIPAGQAAYDPDRLLAEVARLKSAAKASREGLAWLAIAAQATDACPGS